MEETEEVEYTSRMTSEEVETNDLEEERPRKRRKRQHTSRYSTRPAPEIIPTVMPEKPRDFKLLPLAERNKVRKDYERDMMLWIMGNGTVADRPCGPCERTGTPCVRHPCSNKCAICLRRHDVCEYWDESVANVGRRRVGVRDIYVSSGGILMLMFQTPTSLPRLRPPKKVMDGDLSPVEWAENFQNQRRTEDRQRRKQQWREEQRWLDLLFPSTALETDALAEEIDSSDVENRLWPLDRAKDAPPKFKLKIRIKRDPSNLAVPLHISSITLLSTPWPPPRLPRQPSPPLQLPQSSTQTHAEITHPVVAQSPSQVSEYPISDSSFNSPGEANENLDFPPWGIGPSQSPSPPPVPPLPDRSPTDIISHPPDQLNQPVIETPQEQNHQEYEITSCSRCFAFQFRCWRRSPTETSCAPCQESGTDWNCAAAP